MPWKECNYMDERLRLVARLLDGEKMAAQPTASCRLIGEANNAKDTSLGGYLALQFLTPCAAEALIPLPIEDNRDRGAEPTAHAVKRTQQ